MNFDEIREEHWDCLPTIRIQKAVLQNFKSVKYGEVVFACGKNFVPYDTKSDILGLYGQNGSGKTSFIEALAILKSLLCGRKVPNVYTECISADEEFSTIEFTFDLQYPNDTIRTITYNAKLSSTNNEETQDEEMYETGLEENSQIDKKKINIISESISMGGFFGGKKTNKSIIIDTSLSSIFSSSPKRKAFIGNDEQLFSELNFSVVNTKSSSKSSIFAGSTMNVFKKAKLYSEYYQVLLELQLFAKQYFCVVDTKSSGLIRLNFALPFYSLSAKALFPIDKPIPVSESMFNDLKEIFEGINLVINQLIPKLKIDVESLSPAIMKDGSEGHIVEFVAIRDSVKIPLRYESDGVRKIISILNLLISAYNDRSVTIAIDELDAGVFEYLLGEILQAFEESGKGQLIFTSHNLRPLEVLNKDFILFTTTNPFNRYVRLKGIKPSNNLRTTYFRELVLGEQEEELYSRTKKYKIVSAFRKAGK